MAMKEISVCSMNNSFKLAYRAVDCYRQSQKLAENQNPAGYESEILVVIELLRLLDRCEELKPLSQIFKGLRVMPDLLSTSNYNFLKTLPDIVKLKIRKTECTYKRPYIWMYIICSDTDIFICVFKIEVPHQFFLMFVKLLPVNSI
jgi:hypothetical protein